MGSKEPSEKDYYYTGADFWNQFPITMERSDGPFDERTVMVTSNDTMQLLNPESLSVIAGPFYAETTGGYSETRQILAGFSPPIYYRVTYEKRTSALQRLWYYRIANAQMFQTRVNRGTEQQPDYVDEARLFLVVQRYPFINGTAYLMDNPMMAILVTKPDGTILHNLSEYFGDVWVADPFSLFGESTVYLVSGNGHRLLWIRYIGPATARYFVTTIAGDVWTTTEFDPNQAKAWREGTANRKHQSALYTPDFLWDRLSPERFHRPDRLPEIIEDDVLAEFAGLQVLPGASGSIRIVNDESILAPLEKYQAT